MTRQDWHAHIDDEDSDRLAVGILPGVSMEHALTILVVYIPVVVQVLAHRMLLLVYCWLATSASAPSPRHVSRRYVRPRRRETAQTHSKARSRGHSHPCQAAVPGSEPRRALAAHLRAVFLTCAY